MLDLLLAIPYPRIDPTAFAIGPFAVRWYALAYVAGLVFAWWHVRGIVASRPAGKRIMEPKDVDDLLFWATFGVVLGGRLGYVLFYKPGYYIEHLDEVFSLWKGGMSFHGGLIGVILAMTWIARTRKLVMLSVYDLGAVATPIGLFLGRMANFINGELWGRPSDVAWAMVFPSDPRHVARHPSQLYEGFLEGIVLFGFLWIMRKRTDALSRPGELGGWFCFGYGLARIVSEFFREPDAHLGYLLGPITMGMVLSVPVVAVGLFFVWRARKRAAKATPALSPSA
ncbi:MAG TPA: prolipoprotein diacylglyceryl transferase [Alphaproteobacteria bacterium]|jgi:phosphatidylglycerol:prolipoprotein diacylglycerol transferase